MVVKQKQAYSGREYNEKKKDELLIYVQTLAKQHGLQGKPFSYSELLLAPIKKIESVVQGWIDENQISYLPFSKIHNAQKLQVEAKCVADEKQAYSDNAEYEEVLIKRLVEERSYLGRKKLIVKLVSIGLWVVSLLEGVFSYDAWRNIHLSIFASFLASAVVTFSVGVGTHVSADYINNAKTKLQFRIRLLLVNVPFIIGFSLLGILRAGAINYMPKYSKVIVPNTSPVILATISYLLFVLALLISVYYWLSPEEEMQIAKYSQHKKKLTSIKKERALALVQKETVLKKSSKQYIEATQNYEEARAEEQQLISYAYQLFAEYLEINARFRQNSMPEFMLAEHQFSFKTYFK